MATHVKENGAGSVEGIPSHVMSREEKDEYHNIIKGIEHGTMTKDEKGMAVTSWEASSSSTGSKGIEIVPQVTEVGSDQCVLVSSDQRLDAFAEQECDEVRYKTMPWWQVGALMIAEIISLGMLALPHAMKTLGLVPGLISLIGFGIFSLYAGFVYGKFREKHTYITNISDAGEVLLGKPGRILFGVASTVVLVFIVAAHIGSFSIAMNVITNAPTCSIAWTVTGMVVSIGCSLPRRLEHVSYLSVVSCVSITASVFVCMASVAEMKEAKGDVKMFGSPTFAEAMTALLNIILAYAGHVTFFGFIAESKRPQDFMKSVTLMQVSAVSLYTVFAVVVYYYAGRAVTAPALSSASPIARKVAYGLALPSIVVSGVINGHIAAKTLWIACWHRNLSVLKQKSFKSIASWTALTVAVYLFAWIIAEAIPSFHHLLALVSALFMGFFSYGVTGIFWLHINWGGKFSSRRKTAMTILNLLVIVIGLLICICGLIASGQNLAARLGGSPFSCADNSKPEVQGDFHVSSHGSS